MMTVSNVKSIFSSAKPITGRQQLTGIAKADVLLVQSRDAKGESEVSVILEVDGKRFGFPNDTWDNLGVPHEWLDQQIEKSRHPLRSRLRGALGQLGRLVG